LPARAVRGEETDLPAARGLGLAYLDRAADHAPDVRALLERPAQRAQERGALAGRRQDGTFETQRLVVLALELHREAQRGEPVGRERRGDLVERGAQREDGLLLRREWLL